MLLSPCCCSASCWYEGTLYVWSTACRLACRSCSHEISLSQKALKDVTDIIFNGTQDVMMPTRAPQTVPVNCCSRCQLTHQQHQPASWWALGYSHTQALPTGKNQMAFSGCFVQHIRRPCASPPAAVDPPLL
jgi:hypothetical protein